jgi:tripartite-type tricarboxylate transporter receptor subunit TctC
MKKLLLIVAAAAATLFSAALRANDYPSRPITIVSVFGPGSASDTLCRIIGDKLGPALGQPIIVEDRPGADGALAASYVHHQPADGYTLLMGTNSPLSADPFIHKDLNYDPIKDFVPITRVGSFTLMLVVNSQLPIHSVKELVDYARSIPASCRSPAVTPPALSAATRWRNGAKSTCCMCRTRPQGRRLRTSLLAVCR